MAALKTKTPCSRPSTSNWVHMGIKNGEGCRIEAKEDKAPNRRLWGNKRTNTSAVARLHPEGHNVQPLSIWETSGSGFLISCWSFRLLDTHGYKMPLSLFFNSGSLWAPSICIQRGLSLMDNFWPANQIN